MKSTPPACEDSRQETNDTPGRVGAGPNLAHLSNDPRATESSKLDRREPPRFAGTPTEAEHLAHAIARIGELDCTRTLPGRLVWYRDTKPGKPSSRIRVTSAGPSLPIGIVAVWEKPFREGPGWLGRREDGRLVPLAMDRFGRFTLAADSGPYQGGLEAWPNGER